MKIKIKPSLKYKMDKEELNNFLHLKRKGSSSTKNTKIYNRKNKHKNKGDKYD